MTRCLATAAVLLLVAACAGGRARSLDPQSSPADPAPRENRALASFPKEEQGFMAAGLHQFSAGDPHWEATRAKWLAMGREEADFLVRAMWAGLLKAQAANQPQLVEKARHELAMIGEPAIPMTAQLLAGGRVYTETDAQTGESREVPVDDFTRGEASEILAIIGAPAVPAVAQVLSSAPSKGAQRAAIETLGNIGDRGGDAAAAPILPYVRGEDDVLRVEAVHALGHFHDATTRAALLDALSDEDPLVRRKSAEALVLRRDESAAVALRQAAERARAAGHLAEGTEMDRAASRVAETPKR
jgi:HEAT repeat protein